MDWTALLKFGEIAQGLLLGPSLTRWSVARCICMRSNCRCS